MSPTTATAGAPLPVIFFHGLGGNPTRGDALAKALEAQGRALVALSFCPDERSALSLHKQVPLAIAQVREVVATDDRFKNGYVFVGHSQGGLLARAVVEEMDDHRVHTLISLAGVQNGFFYGPQPLDEAPMRVLLEGFGAFVLPTEVFDFGKFQDDKNSLRGALQLEFAKLSAERHDLHHEFSFVNLARSPAFDEWTRTSSFLAAVNNVNHVDEGDVQAVEDQQRRKRNFLKLQAAHFFASPGDGEVAPWQTSHFGRYSHVDSQDHVLSKFEELQVVDMRETEEFVNDTFGLRTLSERGALFLHEVPDIPHCGWVRDEPFADEPTRICAFQDVFDQHLVAVLP